MHEESLKVVTLESALKMANRIKAGRRKLVVAFVSDDCTDGKEGNFYVPEGWSAKYESAGWRGYRTATGVVIDGNGFFPGQKVVCIMNSHSLNLTRDDYDWIPEGVTLKVFGHQDALEEVVVGTTC